MGMNVIRFFAMCIHFGKVEFHYFSLFYAIEESTQEINTLECADFFIVSFSVSYIPLLATKKLGTNHSIERDQHASALTFLCFEIQALQLMDINFKKKKVSSMVTYLSNRIVIQKFE